MSGISLELLLSDTDARDRLTDMLVRMDNRKEFFKEAGERILSSAHDRFREETAPDGTPWTPLKAATIRARTRKGQLPLTILSTNTRSGSSLRGSLVSYPSEDELRVGSKSRYGAIHQLGGVIDKPASSRWMVGRRFAKRSEHPEGREVAIPAHQIAIPARPFLGLTPFDEEVLFEEAEDWLTRE